MAKTVLITGANRGIGQQLARMLAKEGWDVLVGARDKQKADTAAARLRKDTGGRLKGVELDVTKDVSVAAQKLRDGAIKLDALVNNAGVMKGDIVETNFFGVLNATLAMLPLMQKDATITNVTSSLAERIDIADREELIAHVRAYRGKNAYAFSKGALNALTKILARELAPIRVNAVDPGWCRTDMGGRGAPRSVEQGAAAVLALVR